MSAPAPEAGPRPTPRVVVAMSGGVDSSVAAALAAERWGDVIGVTLHLAGASSRCCSLADAEDARAVAERLGLRFFVANYTDRFRREVVEPFADAYLAGRTPIPCVPCNTRFKFAYLLERARVFGADRVVSGHYARIEVDEHTGRRRLHRAVDREKDQTYFLFELDQEQLAAVEFPLGPLRKSQVREIARRIGLATAEKPESQEICFVPDGDYARAVERIRPDALPGEGEIVDGQGRVLGRHAGIHRFTVGQRRGLGVSAGGRRYVRELDAGRNRVVVGDAASLLATGARLERVSWIAGHPPPRERHVTVQVRYRHEGARATVEAQPGDRALVHFEEPVHAVAPGQAAVVYDGDEVLGGGWIAGSRS